MAEIRSFIVNVGVNASHGALRSPLFDDGTFVYVPIPEKLEYRKRDGLVRYQDLFSFDELERYIPKRYWDVAAHHDPEFSGCTYGDYPATVPKAATLSRARKGDFLFFLARLVRWREGAYVRNAGFYLIGCQRVSQIMQLEKICSSAQRKVAATNAHYLRHIFCGSEEHGCTIFKGDDNSRLFSRAIPFPMTIVSRVLRCAGGERIHRSKSRTDLQVIGSHTRACRALGPDETGVLMDWIERNEFKDCSNSSCNSTGLC